MTGTGAPRSGGWLVACDLDQTLIYSRSAFRLPADAAEPALVTVEYLDGEPLSYVTQRAWLGLRALAGAAVLVPVTTRTLEQYRRVHLGAACAYAIAANGGHLIVDGEPDAEWAARVRARLDSSGWPLEQVREMAVRLAGRGSWVRTVRDADGLFVYLVATSRDAIPDLAELAGELAAGGWTLSVQGRKVYFVPAALTKEAALAEVQTRAGTSRLAAAGDSLLDRAMLAVADVAVRPCHGELHEQGYLTPAMRVTRSPGVLGGEEIVDALSGLVSETEFTGPAGFRAGDGAATGPIFQVGAG